MDDEFDGVLKGGAFGSSPQASHMDFPSKLPDTMRPWFPADHNWQQPPQVPVAFIPPADKELIAEVSRLHAVIGRYREAAAVTLSELDEIVETEDGAVQEEDVLEFAQRFSEVTKFYEGGRR